MSPCGSLRIRMKRNVWRLIWVKVTLWGGAVVYTGSSYGVYTSPDRVKNFNLQYWDGTAWVDIKNNGKECTLCSVFLLV